MEPFSDSLDRIFGIVFEQFGTDFRTVCVLLFFLSVISKIEITCWLCENHVNASLWMYLHGIYDGCKLYVQNIIIHVLNMLHVVLILHVTCYSIKCHD